MVKRTGPTNYQLKTLLEEMKEPAVQSKFWKKVLKDLSKSSRSRSEVNIYKIDKYAREGEIILVTGKVLSLGELSKAVEVAAVNFSNDARNKILSAKGKVMTIGELLKQNPEGKKVRILG